MCLFGANGAGKTNFLEALTMLAPGRGLRGASLADVARGGEEGARLRRRAWAVSALMRVGEEICASARAPSARPEGSVKRVTRRDGAPATCGGYRAAGAHDVADAGDGSFVRPARPAIGAGFSIAW